MFENFKEQNLKTVIWNFGFLSMFSSSFLLVFQNIVVFGLPIFGFYCFGTVLVFSTKDLSYFVEFKWT
jgi:hypothetical protein